MGQNLGLWGWRGSVRNSVVGSLQDRVQWPVSGPPSFV